MSEPRNVSGLGPWIAFLRLRLLRWARWPFHFTRRWTRAELWLTRAAVREQSRLFGWDGEHDA